MQIIQKLLYIFNFKNIYFKLFLTFFIFLLLNFITFITIVTITHNSNFRISKIFTNQLPVKENYFLGNSKTVQFNSSVNNKIYSLGYNGFNYKDISEIYSRIKNQISPNSKLFIEASSLKILPETGVLCRSYINVIYNIICKNKKASFYNSFFSLNTFLKDLSIRNIYYLFRKDQIKKNLNTLEKKKCENFQSHFIKPKNFDQRVNKVIELEINSIVEGVFKFHNNLNEKDKNRVYYYLSPTLRNLKYYEFLNNYIYHSLKIKIGKKEFNREKLRFLKLKNSNNDTCNLFFDNIHLNFNGTKQILKNIKNELVIYE